jgi:colicin import membrane protein
MSLTDLPRAALGTYIKVLRTPVDIALKATGRGEGAKVAVDRVEASVKEAAGTAVGDKQLKRQGRQSRAAADAREEAIELRAEAEKTAKKGRQKRQSAVNAAEKRRNDAKQRRDAAEQKLSQAAERRKAANTKAAARQEEKIEEEAKRERLEALEREEVALDEREEALTARDEAERLAKEAAAAKAARKNGQTTTA